MTDRTHQYTATRIHTLFLADPTYTLTIPEIAQKLRVPMWRRSSIMRALRRMPNPLRRKKHIMTTYRTEQERVAWISGDRDRAALLARIADLERLVDQLTDELIDLRESHIIERIDP